MMGNNFVPVTICVASNAIGATAQAQPPASEALQQTVIAMFQAAPAVVEAARQAIEPTAAGGR